MSLEVLLFSLVVGAGTYLFRYLPTRFGATVSRPRGGLGRLFSGFLASVGVAAVTALLLASLLPYLGPEPWSAWLVAATAEGRATIVAASLGLVVTLLVFSWRRSVAAATLLGASAYGVVWWLLT